jgi:hypothetical protein
LIVGGVGVASVVTGAILGLSAKSTYDDSSEHCKDNHCNSTGVELRESASGKATASTVAFSIGAAAMAVGITLWTLSPSEPSKNAHRPMPLVRVRTQGLGLSLEALQ